MKYTLSLTQGVHSALMEVIFSTPGKEGAAYLVCGVATMKDEIRLLGREIIPVMESHYLARESDRLSITSASYVPVAKRAAAKREAILFVHSHPPDRPGFSVQDDAEDPSLMRFFTKRAPLVPHGCLVFNKHDHPQGRIWKYDQWRPIVRTRILGRRFWFIDSDSLEAPLPQFFDRQVRAFGPEIQRLLKQLHIGVVGAGGTGSAVIEQLVRLGIGTISIFDGDFFATSNVSRVYGSSVFDEGRSKVRIQQDNAHCIGLGTEIRVYPKHITDERTAQELCACDVIFGCTDRAAPRGILVQLALRYLVPVIDMGAKIKSEEGTIRGIFGRVTTLIPGEACLFCRKRTDPDRIRLESLPPEQRDREIDEGYADELETDEPAVVSFTTAVAAQAVSEFLHRLTGFMGSNRQSSEVLLFFHENTVRTNRVPANADCVCMRKEHWGRGESKNFLGLTWPPPAPTGPTPT